jgi:hypothetical protein
MMTPKEKAPQTAVQWLTEKLTNRQNGVFDGLPHMSVDEIYNQAKEMEKQQIMNAFNNGENKSAEIYYKETYGE